MAHFAGRGECENCCRDRRVFSPSVARMETLLRCCYLHKPIGWLSCAVRSSIKNAVEILCAHVEGTFTVRDDDDDDVKVFGKCFPIFSLNF